MKKIIIFTIILLASLSIMNSLQSIYNLWKKRNVLITTQSQLVKEEVENKKLKSQLNSVSNPQFVEEQARNKLFLIKDGENTVFIPEDMVATGSSQQINQNRGANWLQWWHLFFD